MLNESDIDFMNETRDELLTERQRPITVTYTDKQYDPVTGVLIGEGEVPREVIAVITEISSNFGRDRSMEGGIIFEEGDIKADVSIDLISDIADKVTQLRFDGEDYEILAMAKKGIGRRNRYEIIGRVIS